MSREKLDEAASYINAMRACESLKIILTIYNDILRDLLADKQPGEQQHAPEGEVSYSRLGGKIVADKQPGPSDSSTTSGELNVVSRASESTDSIPTVGKQMNDAASVPQEWSREVADSFPAPQRRIAELKAEVERLTAERDVVRREIEAIREACGWEQESELTSVLVERMHADLKDLRQDLEEVNEFARSLGHGQGTIDNGLVDCLRASFAKYEQLRRLVREFQNARSCRVKWGDVMPANISVYGQVFEDRDEYIRFNNAVTQLSGFPL